MFREIGLTHQEMAKELIAWRNTFAFGALSVDVKEFLNDQMNTKRMEENQKRKEERKKGK